MHPKSWVLGYGHVLVGKPFGEANDLISLGVSRDQPYPELAQRSPSSPCLQRRAYDTNKIISAE